MARLVVNDYLLMVAAAVMLWTLFNAATRETDGLVLALFGAIALGLGGYSVFG
jgi:hypothetical protein